MELLQCYHFRILEAIDDIVFEHLNLTGRKEKNQIVKKKKREENKGLTNL